MSSTINYFEDKHIIDYILDLESCLSQSRNLENLNDYYTLGFISSSYIKKSSDLPNLINHFNLIEEFLKSGVLNEKSKGHLFLWMIENPFLDPTERLFSGIENDMSDQQQYEEEEEKIMPGQDINKSNGKSLRKVYEKTRDDIECIMNGFIFESDIVLMEIDCIFFGLLVAVHNLMTQNELAKTFEKLTTIRMAESSSFINHNQKVKLFIKLYKDKYYDISTGLQKMIENPNIGAGSLLVLKNASIKKKDEISLVVAEQYQIQEKLDQEKSRLEKEKKEMESVDCDICMEKLYGDEIITLDECIHVFHGNCFGEYLKEQIDNSKFPIKCPSCLVELGEGDIKEILDEEYAEKYTEFYFKRYLEQNSNKLVWCITTNCPYLFEKESTQTTFDCPLCKISYCLKCLSTSHEGKCDAAQALNFQDLELKRCPNCKFWIQRNGGCDHMTCRCGFEFCYRCGGIYTKCACHGYNLKGLYVGEEEALEEIKINNTKSEGGFAYIYNPMTQETIPFWEHIKLREQLKNTKVKRIRKARKKSKK